ncbi:hypothetical protein Kpol_1050p114 [Vanderwaltozyma polyspora DSM 70294]|uniref:DNA-directed RNA polymerase III subunit RPC3 n=1 Tax=Vanderwaltozyma polyspora (strain ATCC 22028 / DSM 70294 / BCRC 21397 / CBS 2163 / NBRC 10782 / NRRL Y-8283 / UCD 57-17) TaxID=436907 RepID=A7TF08_VANPO|nr:uncharacterized protein Kpol_1050p114 [Vanderwaltozyma polyspora DSM 70294]EDO19254.1 hypothetical protein Kpol_1050p114 [Vanderwaltozyma polyspora DSM 70294]
MAETSTNGSAGSSLINDIDLAFESIGVSSLEQRTINPETFLYTEIAKSHLGERAAIIIGVLIAKGRLNINELNENVREMDRKSIKTTLVCLIQLRCIKYYTETTYSGKSITHYYFNEDGILLWLYSGLILEEINSRFQSSIAAQIIQNILSIGSITVNQYVSNIKSNEEKDEVYSAFVKLCENGYIVPIKEIHLSPIGDIWNRLYQKEYNAIPRTSTLSDLKKRTEAKNKAKVTFFNYFNEVNDVSKVITIDPLTSLRMVRNDVSLTFNLERFLKSRRSKHLTQFSKMRVGSISSQVYKVALQVTEQKSNPLTNPLSKTGLLQDLDEANGIAEDDKFTEENAKGITFNAIDIAKYLPASLDLRGSLASRVKSSKRPMNSTPEAPPKKLKTEDGFVIPPPPQKHASEDQNETDDNVHDNEDNMDFDYEDTDPHSISLINGHLKLLATSKIPFLRESKPGVYHVPYSELMPALRSSIYDYIIVSTLGPSAMRVRRCIVENKLVSEKVINSTALMKEKDIRSTISSLIQYNVVEIQEVPRTTDRAASRAVFLFRSKERHSYDFMKQNLSWNIANLLYKNDRLKEENFTLLTKANRDDVKGRESELLLPSELNQLKMVNERELNVFSRVSRLLALWEVFKYY